LRIGYSEKYEIVANGISGKISGLVRIKWSGKFAAMIFPIAEKQQMYRHPALNAGSVSLTRDCDIQTIRFATYKDHFYIKIAIYKGHFVIIDD